ncbi:MAG: C-terminal binding protein [Proteobacteria bacterium]|nr:C-terminal binding protein [Pseudomonadota bacterium]
MSILHAIRTDAELETPRVDAALRAAGHTLTLLPEAVSEADLHQALAGADLLLMCYRPVTAAVIAAAPNLKGIVKYGVGIDAIDIPAARARGIVVVNVPEYAEETVAEGAFALLLGLARRFKPIHAAMQAEGWIWPQAPWLGRDLAGSTLGLVGLGRIGSGMARMAQAFRMRVLAYDPYATTTNVDGVERCDDLATLLAECDAVSIHCVLNAETRHLIGAKELRAMRPGAYLVNVSRGEIVDEAALLAALQSGHLGGAALDVYGREPLAKSGHPLSALFDMDNVLLWPHFTFYTAEAMQRLEDETLERCVEILEGRPVLVKSRDPRLRPG